MKTSKIRPIVAVFFIVAFLHANRGMIPINPNAQIFEPNQRAMIAWNGEEEILLLTTDIYASESTLVLEVLPLPSEPEVKEGDTETFTKAIALINRQMRLLEKRNGNGESVQTPGGEVTFHEKIGSHDISVIHLLNAESFVDWVNKYLDSLGVGKVSISATMKTVISEYISDDYAWYVFDIIEIGDEIITNEAIQYRFKTKYLYYPMKITKTVVGNTVIDLLILTPKLLSKFPGLSIKNVKLRHDPVTVMDYELKDISEDMYQLLNSWTSYKMRIWRIEGDPKAFDKDLLAK
ncbi:hypothetical protein A2Y85_06155 [candidate division WOR-3 bacterium RBG_13_43_14]|uniref:DUF2330 domain-containing protein n=1 Tax=candidate division WOR-3 bacterium RBG_13_43_14 TaxID=1802590 RepID=A0A1F4UD35_UNCW3|nr:MAG: hypothetical protein A2Y85_06155 [candidate division WOR-3 bacterium RBG_13_43_14]